MVLTAGRFANNPRLQKAAEDNPSIYYGESDRFSVALIQRALVILGFPMPKSTKNDGFMDGIFGDETCEVVKAFQVKHRLLDAKGRPDGIVGKNTLHRLDELIRPIGHCVIPNKPRLVRQTANECWAAAIESLTGGRWIGVNLVQQFGHQPSGRINYPDDVSRVFNAVGITGGPTDIRDPGIFGRAFLTDLKAGRYIFFAAKPPIVVAHCIVIYGVDGVGGPSVFISYMDPLEGYRTNRLEPILRGAEHLFFGRLGLTK